MPYWWEKYSSTPDDNNSAPPDGAPENHFPDQVNNIQRQAMAAIYEAFALILKPTATAGPITSLPADAITDAFRQQLYDDSHPVGSIRAWVGGNGNPFPTPTNLTATWQICDGTNGTPDLRKKVVSGADPADASPAYTGSVLGSNDTESVEQTGAVEDHILTEDELPVITVTGNVASSQVPRRLFTSSGNDDLTRVCMSLDNGTPGVLVLDAPAFTADPFGSGHAHGHSFTSAPHDHAIDPARTCLEFYMRTA